MPTDVGAGGGGSCWRRCMGSAVVCGSLVMTGIAVVAESPAGFGRGADGPADGAGRPADDGAGRRGDGAAAEGRPGRGDDGAPGGCGVGRCGAGRGSGPAAAGGVSGRGGGWGRRPGGGAGVPARPRSAGRPPPRSVDVTVNAPPRRSGAPPG